MNCDSCNSEDIERDDVRGELHCTMCGYVLEENMPEETVGYSKDQQYDIGGNRSSYGDKSRDRGHLGSFFQLSDSTHKHNKSLMRNLYRTARFSRHDQSLNRGITLCNMVLSYHMPSDSMKERVAAHYRILFRSHQLRGIDLETRAVAVVFYTLRESGVAVALKDIAIQNQVPVKRASKVLRKIAGILGKPWLLHQINTDSWTEVVCFRLDADNSFLQDARKITHYMYIYLDNHDITFTRVNLATAIYISSVFRRQIGLSNYSQKAIAQAVGVVDVSVRNGLRTFLQLKGITKQSMLELTMDEFLEVIRYE